MCPFGVLSTTKTSITLNNPDHPVLISYSNNSLPPHNLAATAPMTHLTQSNRLPFYVTLTTLS